MARLLVRTKENKTIPKLIDLISESLDRIAKKETKDQNQADIQIRESSQNEFKLIDLIAASLNRKNIK